MGQHILPRSNLTDWRNDCILPWPMTHCYFDWLTNCLVGWVKVIQMSDSMAQWVVLYVCVSLVSVEGGVCFLSSNVFMPLKFWYIMCISLLMILCKCHEIWLMGFFSSTNVIFFRNFWFDSSVNFQWIDLKKIRYFYTTKPNRNITLT